MRRPGDKDWLNMAGQEDTVNRDGRSEHQILRSSASAGAPNENVGWQGWIRTFKFCLLMVPQCGLYTQVRQIRMTSVSVSGDHDGL